MSGLTINKAQPRLRGGIPGSKEHQLERLTLAVSRLDVPEVLGQDLCYLFSGSEQEIKTKYCYWRDPEKKIRTLCSQDIRGIDGPITHIQTLRPISLLNLPPTQTLPDSSECSKSDPVQFTFRCFGGLSFWTGRPPLVDVVLSEGWEQSQLEYTFQSFTFKDKRYNLAAETE